MARRGGNEPRSLPSTTNISTTKAGPGGTPLPVSTSSTLSKVTSPWRQAATHCGFSSTSGRAFSRRSSKAARACWAAQSRFLRTSSSTTPFA